MRRTLLALMLLTVVLRAHGQGSPEETAIAEILTAKDAASIEKHLPKALTDALDSVDKSTREQLLSRPRSIMEMKGLKVAEPHDGRAFLAFDVKPTDAEIKHFELVTQKRISNGADAVLVVACVAPERTWGVAEVWMRFEDGEWRVVQLTDPAGSGSIDLEDPEFIAQLVPTEQHKNEMNAIGGLREIVTASVSYSAGFMEFPQQLEMLGGPPDGETTSEHAGLLDPELASTHVRSGYRFSYEKTSIDSYTVTASAIEFGKSGARNFFADESGVIRFTTEDRAATANDPPLEGRRRY